MWSEAADVHSNYISHQCLYQMRLTYLINKGRPFPQPQARRCHRPVAKKPNARNNDLCASQQSRVVIGWAGSLWIFIAAQTSTLLQVTMETSRQKQNGHHFASSILKCISLILKSRSFDSKYLYRLVLRGSNNRNRIGNRRVSKPL